jgi:hypothetical protein
MKTTVDISAELAGEAAKAEIKKLTVKLKNSERKVKALKDKVWQLERDVVRLEDFQRRAEDLSRSMKSFLDDYGMYERGPF